MANDKKKDFFYTLRSGGNIPLGVLRYQGETEEGLKEDLQKMVTEKYHTVLRTEMKRGIDGAIEIDQQQLKIKNPKRNNYEPITENPISRLGDEEVLGLLKRMGRN